MSEKALDRVVRRLLNDRRFTAQFRKDADATLAGYGLTPDEVTVVKRGDQRELLAMGLDPRILAVRPAYGHWWSTTLLRHALRVAAPAAMALALIAAPAGALANDHGEQLARLRRSGPRGLRRAGRRADARASVRRARARVRTRSAYDVGVRRAIRRVDPVEQ